MIKPVSNHVLIQPNKPVESNLIIPKKRRKNAFYGTVIEVGAYVKQDIKVGDEVYYNTSGSKKTEFGLIVPERSINFIK